MSAQEANKELVRKLFQDVWNAKRIEAMYDFLSPDYVGHDPVDSFLAHTVEGTEGAIAYVRLLHDALSEIHFELEDIIAEGDLVVVRFVAEGVHTGALLGIPPSENRVRIDGSAIYRIAEGRIVEAWHAYDYLSLLRQLGAEAPLEPK